MFEHVGPPDGGGLPAALPSGIMLLLSLGDLLMELLLAGQQTARNTNIKYYKLEVSSFMLQSGESSERGHAVESEGEESLRRE